MRIRHTATRLIRGDSSLGRLPFTGTDPTHSTEDIMQITLKRACRAAAVAGVVALVGTVLAQSPDAHIGTWKANLAKSTYNPGPAAKSATTTIDAAGAGTKVIVDQSLADGTVRHWEFTANYDGKDVPVTGNNPDADTIA